MGLPPISHRRLPRGILAAVTDPVKQQHPTRSLVMRPVHLAVSVSVVFISAVSLAAPARAATLCVNTSGKQGCYTSISAAVSAASAGDTITVAPGTYSEQVTITKPLSLVGDNRENTIIAANGHSNGIHVDGFTAPGLAHVVITGFTVQDANFEGILIQNTSAATVSENIVRHNDQNLQIQNGACPGLPAFETNEGDDCGEGIHLMGVDHSTIACNNVELNAGGILVSDETASNHLPATRKELSRHLLSVEMPRSALNGSLNPISPYMAPSIAVGSESGTKGESCTA
jgi:hypothetical protein